MKVKIYYHDTDCGGVVYYANYLKYMEEARTEFLEERGISVKGLVEKGTLFVVARQEIDYKMPAVYGDTIKIKARLTNTSSRKMEFEYDIKDQHGRELAAAKTVMVCVDRSLKVKTIPPQIKERL